MKRLLIPLVLGLSAACAKPPRTEPLYALPGFKLTAVEENGSRPFTREDLLGRAWVVDFVFTNCAGICPALTERMAALKKNLPPDIGFLSISVDPNGDTPARMREYMRDHGIDGRRWVFARASIDETYQLLYAGFRLPMSTRPEAPAEKRVDHSTRFVLIDKNAAILGYYEGLVDADNAALERAARRILEVRS